MERTEMRLHLERHIRKEYGGREDLSPRERAELTRRLSRTLHSSGQSPGVSSRRSGLSERERLLDQVNYERLLERASAQSIGAVPTRSGRSRAAWGFGTAIAFNFQR